MAGRPVTQDVTQIALNTNQGNPQNLGVFQSLDVRAPNSKSGEMAQGLADVLGVAMPFANKWIADESERETQQGIGDATVGKIDPEKARRGIAYKAGVENVETKKMIFGARAAWQAEYAENVDKTLPAAEVAKLYDDFMKEHLGEIAKTNPKMAAKMAPEYLHGMQELVVNHQNQLTKQHIAEADAVMEQEVVDAIGRGDVINFMELIENRVALTGDWEGSRTLGIRAIGEQAIASGRPELMESIPTGITREDGSESVSEDFTAEQRALVSSFREAALAKKLANERFVRGLVKAELLTDWDRRIEAGVPPSDAEIMAQWDDAENPLFKDIDELIPWMTRSNAARLKIGDAALVNGGFDPNTPYYWQIGSKDTNGKEITKERVQEQVNRDVETQIGVERQLDPDASDTVIMARAATKVTATQAFPWENLKSVFTYAPLSDPQAFANAAETFAAIPPEQRATYVPDENRRADLEAYLNRRDTKGQGKGNEAIDELVTVDSDLVKKNLQANRKGLSDADEKIPALVLQDGFWNDIEVNELFDSTYAQRIIGESTRLRVGRGQNIEEAQQGALKDFTNTHMIIDSGGTKRSIKRIPGVTAKVGEAISWVEDHLDSIGKSKGVEIPPGSRLQRDFMSRDDTTFIVIDPTGYPVSPRLLRFPAAQMERTYVTQHPQGNWSERLKKSKEAQERHDAFKNRRPQPDLFRK